MNGAASDVYYRHVSTKKAVHLYRIVVRFKVWSTGTYAHTEAGSHATVQGIGTCMNAYSKLTALVHYFTIGQTIISMKKIGYKLKTNTFVISNSQKSFF